MAATGEVPNFETRTLDERIWFLPVGYVVVVRQVEPIGHTGKW